MRTACRRDQQEDDWAHDHCDMPELNLGVKYEISKRSCDEQGELVGDSRHTRFKFWQTSVVTKVVAGETVCTSQRLCERTTMMLPLIQRKRSAVGSLPPFLQAGLLSPSTKEEKKHVACCYSLHSTMIRRNQKPKRGLLLLYAAVLLGLCWVITVMGTLRRLERSTAWSNGNEVVHVIQTRFMQFQPHLKALGRARLDLLLAMTFPSLQKQTTQRFLWIIRTDPDLEASIRNDLIYSLQSMPNVVLVASNKNPEGFRGAISDITPDSVLVGSIDLVRSYHEAAETNRLLETRLDADDALASDYCETVQEQASQYLDDDSWTVWCADVHVEWQYYSPWNASDRHGALLGIKTPQCITAGLTWGLGTQMRRSSIGIPNNHAKLHTLVPPCNNTDNRRGCLARVHSKSSAPELPMAMRGRTPTSAGMERILEPASPMVKAFSKSHWRDSQPELWRALPRRFGIVANDLWKVRNNISNNLYNIAKDGLQGQCTKGHSCKEHSKEILKKLLKETTKNADMHQAPRDLK